MTAAHHMAAEGYGSAEKADRYHKVRPDYPAEALQYVTMSCNINSNTIVVDVGAGTGKLTRLLVPTGCTLYAVEPLGSMLAKLKENLPDVQTFQCTASSIPLSDESVDVVVAGQAFHWFATTLSLKEFHRILKPKGYLVLLWNRMDESYEWCRVLQEMLTLYQGDSPRYRDMKWKEVFKQMPHLFTPLAHKEFPNIHRVRSQEDIIDRESSVSYIASLSKSQLEKFQNDVRLLLQKYDVSGEKLFIPYITDVFHCQKQ
jgi:ubiquinone/menaquinone biosynthesis C-methylase UbiE